MALALVLGVGCASAAPMPPTPLLWKVSDADNSVYLLGSFHALKAEDYPVSAPVSEALADAELVAFEVSPAEMASPELAAKLLRAGSLAHGKTLQQSVSATTWKRLAEYAARRGVVLDNLQPLEPWFVSMVITLGEMGSIGYDPKQGLDQHLIRESEKAGKAVSGLETADEQIAALDSMTLAEQQQSLDESLDEAANFKQRIDTLHGHWRAGDAVALDKLLNTEFKRDYAQLYERINVARNRAWMPKIRTMLDTQASDDALVVVGALHLLGSDGLVAQLKAKGYRVERL